eukprot:403373028
MLEQTGQTFQSTLLATIIVNVFLQVAVRFSMKLLWRMMNILQLMVNLKRMNINQPSNVISCFDALVDISNLQIIDTQYIKDKILQLFGTANQEFSEVYIDSFTIAKFGITIYFVCRLLNEKFSKDQSLSSIDQIKAILLIFYQTYFARLFNILHNLIQQMTRMHGVKLHTQFQLYLPAQPQLLYLHQLTYFSPANNLSQKTLSFVLNLGHCILVSDQIKTAILL